jgi:hypothetical protein
MRNRSGEGIRANTPGPPALPKLQNTTLMAFTSDPPFRSNMATSCFEVPYTLPTSGMRCSPASSSRCSRCLAPRLTTRPRPSTVASTTPQPRAYATVRLDEKCRPRVSSTRPITVPGPTKSSRNPATHTTMATVSTSGRRGSSPARKHSPRYRPMAESFLRIFRHLLGPCLSGPARTSTGTGG